MGVESVGCMSLWDQPALTKYLNEVGKKKRLTFEEEKTATPSQLIECNLRLPIFAARRWAKSAEELMDRIQDGNVGLIKAAERFDPSFGVHFSTFAMHHIINEIRNASRLMERVVPSSQRAFRLYKQAYHLRELGLPYEAIAAQLEINLEEVTHLFDYSSLSSDVDPTLVDGLTDENDDLISVLAKAGRILTEKEFEILFKRLEGCTYEEIAPEFGVSRGRIQQLYELVVRKLQGKHYERN